MEVWVVPNGDQQSFRTMQNPTEHKYPNVKGPFFTNNPLNTPCFGVSCGCVDQDICQLGLH